MNAFTKISFVTPAPKYRNINLSLIPLINIIFVLQVFFLIFGKPITTTSADTVELPVASSAGSEAAHGIKISIGKSGSMMFEGEILGETELHKIIGKSGNNLPPLTVVADKDLGAKILVSKLTAFKKLGFREISLEVKQP